MIGKEIADALAPFAMWGAIVIGAFLVLWWIVRRIEKSGARKQREKTRDQLEEERHDAGKEIREETAAGLDAFERGRARRLHDDPGGDDPAA